MPAPDEDLQHGVGVVVAGTEAEVGVVAALDAEVDAGAVDGPVPVHVLVISVVTAALLHATLLCRHNMATVNFGGTMTTWRGQNEGGCVLKNEWFDNEKHPLKS